VELTHAPVLVSLSSLGLLTLGWFVLFRLKSLLPENADAPSLLLMQQQIDQLRLQLSQNLDNSAQSIQVQLEQLLGQVQQRLKGNANVLSQTQQNLGERLDNAARAVGSVQRSPGGLEEANRKIYEVGKDIASLQEILRAPKLRDGLGEFFLKTCWVKIFRRNTFPYSMDFAAARRSTRWCDSVIHGVRWTPNFPWKISIACSKPSAMRRAFAPSVSSALT
jgi:DNA anti-recombination protein RmuC